MVLHIDFIRLEYGRLYILTAYFNLITIDIYGEKLCLNYQKYRIYGYLRVDYLQ